MFNQGDKVKLSDYAVSNGIGKRFAGMTGTVSSVHGYLNNGSWVETARVMFCESGKDYGRTLEECRDMFEVIA